MLEPSGALKRTPSREERICSFVGTEQKIVLFFHFYSYSLKYLNDTPLAAAKFQY